MELIKKRIHYVREGKKIFDQFYVDEEYNVPEAKEDVRRIVDTGTELKIEEIRPVENYVRITGKLYFRRWFMQKIRRGKNFMFRMCGSSLLRP